MLLSVYALCFCPKLHFLQYSTTLLALFLFQQKSKQPYVVSHETNHQTTLPPQTTIKQARFYKPCIYDKKLGFNKIAVVIRDSLFVDFGICVLTVVCAIGDIHSKSGFGTNTPQIAGARPKKHLSKIIVFTIRQRKIIRPQTARINIICILHPFHVQNHNKRSYANS